QPLTLLIAFHPLSIVPAVNRVSLRASAERKTGGGTGLTQDGQAQENNGCHEFHTRFFLQNSSQVRRSPRSISSPSAAAPSGLSQRHERLGRRGGGVKGSVEGILRTALRR